MYAAQDRITVALEVRGPKTSAISSECVSGGYATLLAPFWSGMQGLDAVRRFSSGSALVVAKGIGQAPALCTSRYILGHGGQVKALLGPGVIGEVFAAEMFRDEGASVEILPRSKDHNLARFYQELCEGQYDLLVSEGSDQQHRSLLGLCASMERPPAFAWSSNLTMTCAEGICGSCLHSGLRGCKANFAADEIGGNPHEETP
jgi:NAD(P)H-flavin reductase